MMRRRVHTASCGRARLKRCRCGCGGKRHGELVKKRALERKEPEGFEMVRGKHGVWGWRKVKEVKGDHETAQDGS